MKYNFKEEWRLIIDLWKEREKKMIHLVRRDASRLRRLFRTRMLVERGDEEVRRKRIDFEGGGRGVPGVSTCPTGLGSR